jgi:hypothetical protein
LNLPALRAQDCKEFRVLANMSERPKVGLIQMVNYKLINNWNYFAYAIYDDGADCSAWEE